MCFLPHLGQRLPAEVEVQGGQQGAGGPRQRRRQQMRKPALHAAVREDQTGEGLRTV